MRQLEYSQNKASDEIILITKAKNFWKGHSTFYMIYDLTMTSFPSIFIIKYQVWPASEKDQSVEKDARKIHSNICGYAILLKLKAYKMHLPLVCKIFSNYVFNRFRRLGLHVV